MAVLLSFGAQARVLFSGRSQRWAAPQAIFAQFSLRRAPPSPPKRATRSVAVTPPSPARENRFFGYRFRRTFFFLPSGRRAAASAPRRPATWALRSVRWLRARKYMFRPLVARAAAPGCGGSTKNAILRWLRLFVAPAANPKNNFRTLRSAKKQSPDCLPAPSLIPARSERGKRTHGRHRSRDLRKNC